MIKIIIGKQNSGKSELAEKLVLETGNEKKYYLATMKIMDDEGVARVERHRKLREGKGFVTIERQRDIAGVIPELDDPKHSVVLLECVSNLVANEIFDDPSFDIDICDNDDYREKIANKITADIKVLSEAVQDLIIVTNEYDKDDENYDAGTRLYVETLSLTNKKIGTLPDYENN